MAITFDYNYGEIPHLGHMNFKRVYIQSVNLFSTAA